MTDYSFYNYRVLFLFWPGWPWGRCWPGGASFRKGG